MENPEYDGELLMEKCLLHPDCVKYRTNCRTYMRLYFRKTRGSKLTGPSKYSHEGRELLNSTAYVSNKDLKNVTMSRGYKHFHGREKKLVITGTIAGCYGRCGLTRTECLKIQGTDMQEDRTIMKTQEKRFLSWTQRIKEGSLCFRGDKRFNYLNSAFQATL